MGLECYKIGKKYLLLLLVVVGVCHTMGVIH